MLSVQYIPLSVRVRSWSSSLFSSEEIIQLMQYDLNSIYKYTAEKESLFDLDTSDSKSFLRSMKSSIIRYRASASIASYGEGKKLINEIFRSYEIENLKILSRMIISGKFQHSFFDYFLTPSFELSKFQDARTFHDLHLIIRDTIYEQFFPALEKTEQEKNTFYWETALDSLYSNMLSKIITRLDPKSKNDAKNLILLPLHLDRLLLLYRYRFNYGMSPDEALKYISNTTHILSVERWEDFVRAPSSNYFHEQLIAERYIAETCPDDASLMRIAFRTKIENMARKKIHQDLSGIAALFAFFQLKKIQIEKLSTIIEAKILNAPHTEIIKFL